MQFSGKNIAYAARSDRNVLDIEVPQADAPVPLVVFIHGGAFLFGDKTDNAPERGALLAAGFAVASVNYRFSSEAIWPAQLDDLRDSFAFLRANAGVYGIDPLRLASFGPSAGGHLSACIGIAQSAAVQTRLRAAIVWYPPVDFPTMDADIIAAGTPRASGRNDAPGSPESLLAGAVIADHPAAARLAGPIAQLDLLPTGARLPDFLIMHGAQDPYIAARQSQRLQAALSEFGTAGRLELEILPQGTHGGGDFAQPAAMERVIAFLARSFADRAA